jgi:hypothetical protein
VPRVILGLLANSFPVQIQRYSLASFYHATNGDYWRENTGWLSDEDECDWFQDAVEDEAPTAVCNEEGRYIFFRMEKNNMTGTLPAELSLLADSLGEYGVIVIPVDVTIFVLAHAITRPFNVSFELLQSAVLTCS